MSFERGSEWRKWDLHAHTALDYDWINKPKIISLQEKQQFAKDYIAFAVSQTLSVVAITDHNFCNDLNESLIPHIQDEAKHNNITILPGFEITAKDGSGIHLLVIFSEDTSLQIIHDIVKQCFPVGSTLVQQNVPVSTKSIDELKVLLDESKQKYNIIFAHADSTNGVLDSRTISGTRRVDEWNKDFIKIVQLSKEPKSITTSFYTQIINKVHLEYKGNKTWIIASDCRCIDISNQVDGRTYLGEKFVWIKANPTFDGLKQIVYEPELRVAYGDTNPYEINPKPFFSQINFNEQLDVFGDSRLHIEQQVINLNRDLVAIIGGRGSGKSILLDVILKAFEKSSTKNERIDSLKNSQDITIEYNKIDMDKLIFIHSETNNLDYVHISQGEVKDVIRDEQKLSEEIFRMLNISSDISSSIGKELMGIFNDYCNELDSMGKIDLSNTEIQIKKYQDLIGNLQNEKNKEKVNEFIKNEEKKNNLESLKQQINKSLQEFTILEEKINGEVKEISDKYQELCKTEITLHNVDFSVQKNDFQHMSSQISISQEECEELNKKIKQQFIEMDIKDDIKSLTEKLAEYEKKLSEQKRIIKDAEESQKKKDTIISNFIRIANELSQQYTNKKNEILHKWSDKSNQDTPSGESDKAQILKLLSEGINIDVEISFDKQKFLSIFDEGINGQKFRQAGGKTKIQRINEEILDISSYDDFVAFIRNELKFKNTNVGIFDFIEEELPTDDYFYSKQDLIKKVLQNLQNILSVRPVLQIIDNSGVYKTTNQLSAGQKGTLYTKIKLLTNAFDTPVLFDQPEDDLDNDFIMKSLVHLFRQLKKYRQIIIVTHNPNLVINADAEQVIIAKNREESISYLCGAIEEEEIRREICQILEGGEEAFKKREQKYNI